MQRNKYDIDETLESPFSLKHLKRSFIYIKRHGKKLLSALAASMLASVLQLSVPQMLQYAVDEVVPAKDYRTLILLTLGTAAAIIAGLFLLRYRMWMTTKVGQDIIYEIRGDLFSHMQKLPFTYYDNRPHGKILIRVVQYVNSVSNMLSNGVIDFFLEFLNLLLIIVFMLVTSPSLTLVVVAGLPIFFVIMFSIKPAQRRAWQRVSNKNSNLNSYAQESINGMRITQIFAREKKNEEIFGRLAMLARKAHFKAGLIANLVNPAVENISQLIFSAMYLVGVLWNPGMASFGTLLAMGSYSWQFWQPINRLSQIYNEFMNTIAYLERIFETMDEKVLIDDAANAYDIPQIKGEVKFEDVTFGYDSKTQVLKNLSFTINAGESVALVGPTGAGKTTIVNLLSRFYDVTGGRITIDGHDIRDVKLHSLRDQMGIMLQDSFIFSGTIADNIRYGKLTASQEEIQTACAVVKADEFIAKTEHRYDTEVKEHGGNLSQGQKQLIAFARTIISDPRILVLDEATSAIDTKTEAYVQAGIKYLLGGRTSFIIAHRLSTIRECDRIMYIKDGGISEQGTHTDLMSLKGDYYKLYTSQLQDL
ncbi:MAG: ABC transporter ATP-binding protein/permease [Oscillospiraceae bacterium]|jgi:ATP-binding cassette subfamily B protein|nr:ABC transporter ATP-binding protein/permease [Oscillospiraceae bacterium]